MADIAGLLKSEIVRLSKKTSRQEVSGVRKASVQYRRDIAALKQRLASLEKEMARLRKKVPADKDVAAPAPEDGAGQRFVAKGLRSLRARLGISADDFGKLIGVSGQSVYNWEHEKARPRRGQVAAIAAVRSMGKRDARQRLDELAGEAAG